MATPVEHGDVLGEEERAGRDAEADGEQHTPVAGAQRRRPHEEHQRGRDRGERRLPSEREPVGDRGHAPDREHGEQDGAVGGGRGRRRGAEQVPPAGELAVERAPRVAARESERGGRRLEREQHEDRDADERPGARPPTPAIRAAAPARRGRAGGAPRRAPGARSGRSRRRAPATARRPRSSAASANGARKRARRAMRVALGAGDRRAGEGLVPCGRERRSRRVDHDAGTRRQGRRRGG